MTISFQEACAAVCAPGTRFEIIETEVLGLPTKVFAAHRPTCGRSTPPQPRRRDFLVYEDERWPMPKVRELSTQIGTRWSTSSASSTATASRSRCATIRSGSPRSRRSRRSARSPCHERLVDRPTRWPTRSGTRARRWWSPTPSASHGCAPPSAEPRRARSSSSAATTSAAQLRRARVVALEELLAPAPRCPTSRSIPTTTRRSSTRRARPATEGRRVDAPSDARRAVAFACRSGARRRDPQPEGPDPDRRRLLHALSCRSST